MTGVLRHLTWWFLAYGSVGCLWVAASFDYRYRNEPEWLRTGQAVPTLEEPSPAAPAAQRAVSDRMAALAAAGLHAD